MTTSEITTNAISVGSRSGVNVNNSWRTAKGRPETIPAKIRSETPFPNPFSVMSSPNHMRNTVPAVAIIIFTANPNNERSGIT